MLLQRRCVTHRAGVQPRQSKYRAHGFWPAAIQPHTLVCRLMVPTTEIHAITSITTYISTPGGMKGWVGQVVVGWPIADRLSTKWSPVNNVSQNKTWHHTHVDNFAKNWLIFKILSLIDSEQNFLQSKYCIAHDTLQMLLHYLVKLQCFKNRIN